MNDERILNGPAGQKMKMKSKNVDLKPMFTITPSKIFTNLHHAAQLKALEVINTNNESVKNINKIIVNTGMSDDGRFMDDAVNAKVKKNGTMSLGFRTGGKYEVGIVFLITKFPDLSNLPEDEHQREKYIEELTKQAIEPIRELALNGINTYFKWFAGKENIYSDQDIEEFAPSYKGEKIEFKKHSFPGFSWKDFIRKIVDGTKSNRKYNSNRDDEVNNVQPEHGKDEGKDYKPRIGFKVTYQIID